MELAKKVEKTAEEKAKSRQRSNENLMPVETINSRLTPEERREKASRAGKASVEKKKANRVMMDLARKLLSMDVPENQSRLRSVMKSMGIDEQSMNYASAILAIQLSRAVNGDAAAAKYVRDSAGFDPMSVMKEEQFEYMKENGQNINVNLEGEVTTKSRVQIYLPERDEDPE